MFWYKSHLYFDWIRHLVRNFDSFDDWFWNNVHWVKGVFGYVDRFWVRHVVLLEEVKEAIHRMAREDHQDT